MVIIGRRSRPEKLERPPASSRDNGSNALLELHHEAHRRRGRVIDVARRHQHEVARTCRGVDLGDLRSKVSNGRDLQRAALAAQAQCDPIADVYGLGDRTLLSPRIAESQNSSEPETGAADATSFAVALACPRAVEKLDLRTVSLLIKKRPAASTATAVPADKPNHKGRTSCFVMLRTSKLLE